MASQQKSRGCCPQFWLLTTAVYWLASLQQASSQASARFDAITSPVIFNDFQPAGTTVAIINVASSDVTGVSVSGGVFSIPAVGDAQYFKIATIATDTGASGNLTSAVVFDGKNPLQDFFTIPVTFTAADGVTTATSTVYVQLQYVNQPPHFANRTYDVWLPSDTLGGSTFFTLTADDPNPIEYQYVPDSNGEFILQYLDNSGVVTYSIDGGFGSNLFAVDSQTGMLSIAPKVNLSVATGKEFNLTIKATDGAGLTDIAIVYVHVTAVNAHAPVITSPLALSLPEDTPVGYTVLGEINATDEDAGSNGQIHYLISSGNVAGTFSIDPSTGRLVVLTPLSWILAPNYNLAIVAQDGGTPPLSDTAVVVVTVLRVYNYPPVFSQPSYIATVQENLPVGTEVVQVVAYEPIVEDFVTYSIVSGSDGAFAVDQLSGLILTNATLSRTLTPSFNMTVMAVDNYANKSLRMSAFATVYIEVVSSNDHPPRWKLPAYKMDTFAAPIRTDIGTMTATSDNQGAASVITYSFSSLDPMRPWAFRIYPATGLVRTNESVSIDIQEYYYYTVRAEVSSSLFVLYADVPLTIQVHTRDLFPPMFSVHSVNITLIGNVTVGTVVLNQTAVDWDTGLNGRVWYRILTTFDPSAGSFDVNATSGQVYVNTSLNYGLK